MGMPAHPSKASKLSRAMLEGWHRLNRSGSRAPTTFWPNTRRSTGPACEGRRKGARRGCLWGLLHSLRVRASL